MKIASVLKYEGDNKTLIWKHPEEDFNHFTQLIVHESQEAIFFMNGKMQDCFGPGRYTLKTENIPFITAALNQLTDGENPFHCEVYFVNKVEQMAIKWGTPNQFYFNENINGTEVPFQIGARGDMSVRVADAKKLLLNLVGTEDSFTQDKLMDYFFEIVASKVKSSIAKTMREQGLSIFTVDEHLTELSIGLKPLIEEDLLAYGIQLERFIVSSIKKPEGEPEFEKYRKLKFAKALDLQAIELEQQMLNVEKQGEIQRSILESQGRAVVRQQEGYTYQQERNFDIAGLAAANEGVGQYSNLGIGLGMMAGVSENIGCKVGAMANEAMNASAVKESSIICSHCNSELPAGAMFCFKCGQKVVDAEKCECPSCKGMVPKGAFCILCGHNLNVPRMCKKCGNELMKDAAFCLSCGEKVE